MFDHEHLEEAFCKYFGTTYAVSCSTGTAALHLALEAIGVQEGDEVIIPNFTMGAVRFAVCYTGARPVLVDCMDDMNINPNLVKKAITPRTKAIIAVHTYGRPCDMDSLMKMVEGTDIKVIEDCSEAHGATYKGRRVGQIGDMGCFSLYRNKIVRAEEGGIITTNDPIMADRIRDMKNMCFGKGLFRYKHTRLGFNYRMADSQARLALQSLRHIGLELNRRFRIEGVYSKYLTRMFPKVCGQVTWFYDTRVEVPSLTLLSVPEARPFFYPLDWSENSKAHELWKHGILLPMDVSPRKAKKIALAVVASQQ